VLQAGPVRHPGGLRNNVNNVGSRLPTLHSLLREQGWAVNRGSRRWRRVRLARLTAAVSRVTVDFALRRTEFRISLSPITKRVP
jgi:hypothetical protein